MTTQPDRPDLATPVPILVVDDDPDVRELVADLMSDAGYLVIQASGPHEALSIVESQPGLRVMISDVRMPLMSGIELADRACAHNAGLRVLLMSGYVPPEESVRPFLRKPFRGSELAALVRRAIDD